MSAASRRALIAIVTVTVVAMIVAAALALGYQRARDRATEVAQGSGATPSRSSALPGSLTPSLSVPPVTGEATSSSPTPARPEPVVTIAAVGDIALGDTPKLPADPTSYLAPVSSALAAPIVFGNLEGALSNSASGKCQTASPTSPPPSATAADIPNENSSPTSTATPTPSPTPTVRTCFAFRMPPSYATVLRRDGFTVLNSANNHSHDAGAQGVADTTTALRHAGIAQTGLPGQIAVVSEDGVKVAFVGFAPYANANNLLDDAAARTLVTSAKQRADLVVVYMHAGAEGTSATHVTGQDEHYVGEDRGNPERFAHEAIDAGADLVIASGPHVLRGMEFYRGHLIAYSLGDFAGYYNFATTETLGYSGVLRVGLSADGQVATARFISVALDPSGRPSVDSRNRGADLVNELSAADFGARAAVIDASGTIRPAA